MARVYSTDQGRLCPGCEQPVAVCHCSKGEQPPAGDGIVRISRQSKGRGGKTVTLVQGLQLDTDGLKQLAQALKQKAGCGGAIKDWVIELQGDRRDMARQELEKRGYKVRLSGG